MNPVLFLLLLQVNTQPVILTGSNVIVATAIQSGAPSVAYTLSGSDVIAATMVGSDVLALVPEPTFSTPLTRVFTFPSTYTQGIGLTASPDAPAAPLTLPGPTVSVSA